MKICNIDKMTIFDKLYISKEGLWNYYLHGYHQL